MLDPVTSNTASKDCPQPIGSDCVILSGAIPGTSLCKGASLTQGLAQVATLAVNAEAAVDVSGINLGCLYEATIQKWTCPLGQTYQPFGGNPTTGIIGACYTGNGTTIPYSQTLVIPVLTTTPNPVPPPTTLVGILQLMISKIPCCDPCNSSPNISGT